MIENEDEIIVPVDSTKYYFTHENNLVSGFYNTADHVVIPDCAIEVTAEQRDAAIAAQSNGKILCVTKDAIDPQNYPDLPSNWNGKKWVVDKDKKKATTDALRLAAYREESDSLFFKEQRGEVPAGTWATKVAEIRARYP